MPYGIEPLPEPCDAPVLMHRIQRTPCTPEDLMATFLTVLREAGRNQVTVETASDGAGGPAIQFTYEETR